MQVSFDLRRDKVDKHGLMPVRALITFDGFRIRRVVQGAKSDLKHWNEKNERIKPPLKSEAYNYHLEYNDKIERFEQKSKEIFRFFHINEINPTKEDFLSHFNSDKRANISNDFLVCFDEFIETGKLAKVERTMALLKIFLS